MTSYPQIDYTSRDFLSLVQDMTALIDSRVPEWTNRSQNDFGMVMIELFAYMGDILSYYGDRIANEAFLATATQRESVLAIARLLDYNPSGPVAASVGLQFTNTTGSYVWVLQGTRVVTKPSSLHVPNPSKPFSTYQLAAQAPVYFETVADVLVPPNGSATVTAIEGVTYDEQVGVSDGVSDQDFPLFRTPVIDHSVTVSVGTTKWAYYERLVDAYPTTRAYTLETDGDNVVHVQFGDGANGAIPPIGQTINVAYRVGGGKRGNVTTGAISRIVSTLPAGIKVTNPAPSVGGGEAETLDQIKVNAPRSLFALQRAVSLADYVGLALRVGGVGKVSVPPPSVYSSVTMFIAPTGGGGVDDNGVPTADFIKLKNRVFNYLYDKIPLGTTLTMGDPVYVPIQVNAEITVKPQYVQDEVRHAVVKALVALFDFNNVVFGDVITLKDVHTALATVAGVQTLNAIEVSRDAPPVINVERFDTLPTGGTGWTVDNSVYIQAGPPTPASLRRQGPGTAYRTFAAVDYSAVTQFSLRIAWNTTSTKQYVSTTLILTDVNGNTYSLGTRSPKAGPITTSTFNTARWDVDWPDDADVFDSTQVTRYDLTFAPSSGIANSRQFWVDMMLAYVAETNDITFAAWELPRPFLGVTVPTSSQVTVAATGGLLKR